MSNLANSFFSSIQGQMRDILNTSSDAELSTARQHQHQHQHHHNQWQHQQQGGYQMPETPPPASLSFLNAMRETQVTGDDLIEENNKECLVCLDENRLGGMAVKMPCGHLYHKECISEWLRKQGSCPVCRYEVESSDPMYEVERKKRMRNTRKLRMRRDELKKKKVAELRQIARQLSIDISGCIDKSEITDIFLSQGNEEKFDFTEAMPVQEIDEESFQQMSVKQLRQLLLSFGISDQGMLDKNEMRIALVESGRIALVSNDSMRKGAAGVGSGSGSGSGSSNSSSGSSGSNNGSDNDMQIDESGSDSAQPACGMPASPQIADPRAAIEPPAPVLEVEAKEGDASAAAGVPHVRGLESEGHSTPPAIATPSQQQQQQQQQQPPIVAADPDVLQLGKDVVAEMSVRELKSIMEAFGISTAGCLERSDLLHRLNEHPKVALV